MVGGAVWVTQIQPQWSTNSGAAPYLNRNATAWLRPKALGDRALAAGVLAQPAKWPSLLTRQAGLPGPAFTVELSSWCSDVQ